MDGAAIPLEIMLPWVMDKRLLMSMMSINSVRPICSARHKWARVLRWPMNLPCFSSIDLEASGLASLTWARMFTFFLGPDQHIKGQVFILAVVL